MTEYNMCTRLADGKVVTGEFRVSFAHVFEPKLNQTTGLYKFALQMLIPKTCNIEALKAIAREAVAARWPDPSKVPPLDNPVKDGDIDIMSDGVLRREKYPECAGCWVIDISEQADDRQGQRKVTDILGPGKEKITSPSEFYSGCYARAVVNAFTYAKDAQNPQKRNGFGFGFKGLQKLRDGDPLGAPPFIAEDVFTAVPGAVVSPFAGATPGAPPVQPQQYDQPGAAQPQQYAQPGVAQPVANFLR